MARYLTTVLEKWPCGYQSVVSKVIRLLKTTERVKDFFCNTLDKVAIHSLTVVLKYFVRLTHMITRGLAFYWSSSNYWTVKSGHQWRFVWHEILNPQTLKLCKIKAPCSYRT